MAAAQMVGITLYLLIYIAVGAGIFRRWRASMPTPSIQINPTLWLRYWLPKTIAFEAWGLVGSAVPYFVLAFLAPTVHGADEHYFKLGGAVAFPLFIVIFALLDAYTILHVRHRARRQAAL